MKRILLAAFALALGAPAMAAVCTSTSIWTTLGPPGSVNFGQTFGAAGSYTDCYTFTLSTNANSNGTTLENNLLFEKLLLDVTSVSLFSGGLSSGATTGSLISTDTTPDAFQFTNLAGGTYTMAVSSTVYNSLGLYTAPVGYTGTIKTVAGTPPVSVPEPASWALVLASLAGLGAASRRRA